MAGIKVTNACSLIMLHAYCADDLDKRKDFLCFVSVCAALMAKFLYAVLIAAALSGLTSA